MPVGDRQPIELLQDDQAWADEPRRLAEDVFGHRTVPDGCDRTDPHTCDRLTCSSCGRAVLRIGRNIYGSAVQVGCQFTEAGRRYNKENGVQW